MGDLDFFVVQPSGMTPWGDDWHGSWSANDAFESTRDGLNIWAKAIQPCLPKDHTFYFFGLAIVAGHSNGGHPLGGG
jgi:hypothetical protein